MPCRRARTSCLRIACRSPRTWATKTVAQAVQSSDFKFRKLAIPVTVADGVLEMRRASFRDEQYDD